MLIMLKLFIISLFVVFFNACGVDTDSSKTSVETEEEINTDTEIIDNIIINPISGFTDLDLFNQNQIDTGSSDLVLLDSNIIVDNGNTTDPDDNTTAVSDGSESIFDKQNAVEDKFACMLGDSNDGYTNNLISDTSIDNRGVMDEEDGIGINSLLPYNDDQSKTKITVFYYDLKPSRDMQVISSYETGYRIDIDTGWAYNDEKNVYVQTPKDENDLYGCYRYELSSIDEENTLTAVKVYRNKI